MSTNNNEIQFNKLHIDCRHPECLLVFDNAWLARARYVATNRISRELWHRAEGIVYQALRATNVAGHCPLPNACDW